MPFARHAYPMAAVERILEEIEAGYGTADNR
jgi:hypothetical protein